MFIKTSEYYLRNSIENNKHTNTLTYPNYIMLRCV